MIRISKADGCSNSVYYRVAGKTIISDELLWPLAPFRISDAAPIQKEVTNVHWRNFQGCRLKRTEGWLGERIRKVKILSHAVGQEVYLQDVGRIFVANDGSRIRIPQWRNDAHRALLIEATVGAALVLALAQQDIYCLHASAVVYDGAATLFCGPSGIGKSTLAYRLPGYPGCDMRLADDIAALQIENDRAWCLGHFPQLKLGADEHCRHQRAERVAIDRIVILKPAVTALHDSAATVNARRPESGEAVLSLARHTVAARLFDNARLSRHLTFCAQLAASTNLFVMNYPHHYQAIEEVAYTLGKTHTAA